MYGELTKTQSEEEEEVKCNVTLCTNDSVSLERKRRQLNETTPNEYVHDVSQSDLSLNENTTENTFNDVATVVQGPTGDDEENKSQKSWMMEMLMSDGDILTTMTNGPEEVSEDYKKFLYTRATHSNHVIQYHMQQIIERQKVVDEYRSMTMEGMGLISLESNLHKNDPVVISQIIQMIEVVEKPQFSIGLISSCADQFSSCVLHKSKIACVHVSFTTYEYFYKLSKSASFSRWLLHPVPQKNQ